jgi:cysteine desulfurase family protein
MIYLDNAATSWPKPDGVGEAMLTFMEDIGASPGRSGHARANDAERVRFEARQRVAALFGVHDPLHVVFALNATAALNLVLQGMLPPGSHVVTTSIEHNAVMRPLRRLRDRGVNVSVAHCGPDGTLAATALEQHIRPETRLVAVTHASNVCGTVLPVRDIGARCRRHGVPLLVDAAQTGGTWPIDLAADHIDLLAFSGHKGLLGPPGVGGLALGPDFDIDRLPPLIVGGTGSRSEHDAQPDFLPDKYEAGTPNTVGLAGLNAALQWIEQRGVERIRSHERQLTAHLIERLRQLDGVRVLGTLDAARQTAVVSFVAADRPPSELAGALDERFAVLCRPGLQCAPAAHETLGTAPAGTVRLSPGAMTRLEEIDAAVDAVAQLVGVE